MIPKALAAAPLTADWLRSAALLAFALSAFGCREEEGITQYTVPQAEVTTDPQYAWYVKLTGPPEVVEQMASRFQEFVKSIEVGKSQNGSPNWELPEGWTTTPATDGVNYVRITTDESDAVVAVSAMELVGGKVNSLHANYNRWRGQVGLQDVAGVNWLIDADVAGEHEVIEGVAGEIHLFDFQSDEEADEPERMLAAVIYQESGDVPEIAQPVATDELPEGHPPIGGMSDDLPPALDPDELHPIPWTYEVPDTWVTRLPNVNFNQERLWTAHVDGAVVRISMATSGGSLVENLARWAGQAGIPIRSEDDLDRYVSTATVGGHPADSVMFEGAQESVGGAIVSDPAGSGYSWFIKINGPPAAVEKVRDEFDAFVATLEFVE